MKTLKRKPKHYDAFQKLVKDVGEFCTDNSYPFYSHLLEAYETLGSKLDDLICYLLTVSKAVVQHFPDMNKIREEVFSKTFAENQYLIRSVDVKLHNILCDKYAEYSAKLKSHIESLTNDKGTIAFLQDVIKNGVREKFVNSHCVIVAYYLAGKFLSQCDLSSLAVHDIAWLLGKLEKEIEKVMPPEKDSIQTYESRLFVRTLFDSLPEGSAVRCFAEFAHPGVMKWLFVSNFLSKIKNVTIDSVVLLYVLFDMPDETFYNTCLDFRNLGYLLLGLTEKE